MANTYIYCPFCKEMFDGEIWENGSCPLCHKEYYWTEECNEDYSECWANVDWEE